MSTFYLLNIHNICYKKKIYIYTTTIVSVYKSAGVQDGDRTSFFLYNYSFLGVSFSSPAGISVYYNMKIWYSIDLAVSPSNLTFECHVVRATVCIATTENHKIINDPADIYVQYSMCLFRAIILRQVHPRRDLVTVRLCVILMYLAMW